MPSSNLRQFAARMNRSADRLPRAVNAVKQAAGRAITVHLIDSTPVDTGEARSNWIVSLGVPIRGTIAPYVPYPKFSKGNGQGIAETANAERAKARAEGPLKAVRPGQSLVIQNNVEYIGLLNAGSSTQAPALFVEMAVAAGIRSLSGAKLVI